MLSLRAVSFVLLLRIAQKVSAASLPSSLHAVADARGAKDAGQPRQPGTFTLRHDLQEEQRRCADVKDIPVSGLNLTHDERALLPHICWQPHRVPRRTQKLPQGARQQDLPPGVHCEAVQWWASLLHHMYRLSLASLQSVLASRGRMSRASAMLEGFLCICTHSCIRGAVRHAKPTVAAAPSVMPFACLFKQFCLTMTCQVREGWRRMRNSLQARQCESRAMAKECHQHSGIAFHAVSRHLQTGVLLVWQAAVRHFVQP